MRVQLMTFTLMLTMLVLLRLPYSRMKLLCSNMSRVTARTISVRIILCVMASIFSGGLAMVTKKTRSFRRPNPTFTISIMVTRWSCFTQHMGARLSTKIPLLMSDDFSSWLRGTSRIVVAYDLYIVVTVMIERGWPSLAFLTSVVVKARVGVGWE